ncbi:MAG: nucleoside triphosphate pyrophosphohydrolase [Spirochaetia bacterium]|nr:nucleoside triphosphate pyrophosphohydrolase [Spirochaetia bacterium]
MGRRYDKLVRDEIPKLIRASGGTCTVRVLDDREYRQALYAKLTEETEEYLQEPSAEELCDILEVVYALGALEGLSPQQLEEQRVCIQQQRGGFDDRWYLVETDP